MKALASRVDDILEVILNDQNTIGVYLVVGVFLTLLILV